MALDTEYDKMQTTLYKKINGEDQAIYPYTDSSLVTHNEDDNFGELIDSHIENTNIHVTEAEKETWNKSIAVNSTEITMPIFGNWTSITYGGDKFVAVSITRMAAYSYNGIDWIQATISNSAQWKFVTYGSGKFVAVSYNSGGLSTSNIAAYSEDGINWIETMMPASAVWNSICYGDGKFVAIASDSYLTSSNIAAYSEDGINWTQTTMPTSAFWYSVCYGDGKFVAIASYNNIAAYSTDGINWTQITMPAISQWYSICHGDGKFVAIGGNNGDNYVSAYSYDGINWTQTIMPECSYTHIAYGNGKFIATNNIHSAYSYDGINWIEGALPVNEKGWGANCYYGNGKFVIIDIPNTSTLINIVAYSTDGINWYTEYKNLVTGNGDDVTEDVKSILDIESINNELEDHTHEISDVNGLTNNIQQITCGTMSIIESTDYSAYNDSEESLITYLFQRFNPYLAFNSSCKIDTYCNIVGFDGIPDGDYFIEYFGYHFMPYTERFLLRNISTNTLYTATSGDTKFTVVCGNCIIAEEVTDPSEEEEDVEN